MNRQMKFRFRVKIRKLKDEHRFDRIIKPIYVTFEEMKKNKLKDIINNLLKENERFEKVESNDQYTESLDKNHTEIYENDVVKDEYGINHIILFGENFNGKHMALGFYLYDIEERTTESLEDPKKIEVIGNTHDNPELLAGDGNG